MEGKKTAPKLTKKILAEAQEMPKTGVFLHHFSLFWHTRLRLIFSLKNTPTINIRGDVGYSDLLLPHIETHTHTHKRERERRGPEVYSSNNDNSTPLSIRLVSRFRTLARFRRKE